jgi:GNAT superfamily N-acetyltransferase
VDFRPAAAGDLPAQFEVFELAQRELHERRGAEWRDRDFSEWERLQLHLLQHDGARCFVAEDAGRVVGFTAAWARKDVWFLSALFVHPEHQARGIGKRLLSLAWGEGYRRRIAITEALQRVSTATYARRGLIPTTPVLALEGKPRALEPERLEPASPDPDAPRFLDQAASSATSVEAWVPLELAAGAARLHSVARGGGSPGHDPLGTELGAATQVGAIAALLTAAVAVERILVSSLGNSRFLSGSPDHAVPR